MAKNPTDIIIFTDLDGSLLDHQSYNYEPAMPVIDRLKKNKIPLVAVTSKTLAEIAALTLPFDAAIGENGMVADIPEGFFPSPYHKAQRWTMGSPYENIIHFIETLPDGLRNHITGFNTMTVKDVVMHTGLPESVAILAKNRLCSEPFLWSGNEDILKTLKECATRAHLKITRGGRFYNLMSEGGKGSAITWVIEKLQSGRNTENITSIALGDGPNDSEMLAHATFGVQIPNPHGKSFTIQNPRGTIVQASAEGPKGWALALNTLLDKLDTAEP